MTFIPISACCLQGTVMSGTPRGTMQLAGEDGIHVARYFVGPTAPVATRDKKIALVMLYDIFGFSIPNVKLIADAYADKLGVDVYIPDYLPHPAPSSYIEPSIEHYPGEKEKQSWAGWIWDKVRLLPMLPLVPGILDWKAAPLVDQAITDLQNQGYTHLVSVGYCRGGSMSTYLLAKGDDCPLTAAVVMHPAWEPERFAKFTKPSFWVLADIDQFITAPRRKQLQEAFKKNTNAEWESKFFPNTVHGFGCRPAAEHEGMQAAFQDANDLAVTYLKNKLGM